jgi:hypothetical protein
LKARRNQLRIIGVLFLVTAILLIPHLAGAQTPSPPLPGETPEASRPYATYWLSFVVLAGIAGLILALGFAYWRLSGRFYGREEPPPPRQRPRFAAMSAAQPMAAAPQGAASAQRGAAAAARADAPAGHVPAPAAPPPAGATETKPAADTTAAVAEAPAAEAEAEQPTEAPAAEAEPAEAEQPTEAPADEAEKAAEEQPSAESTIEKAAAPAAAAPPAGGPVEPDQETFDRVLQEQVDKGVDRRVAEGRAKAAAIKAAREKAGAA